VAQDDHIWLTTARRRLHRDENDPERSLGSRVPSRIELDASVATTEVYGEGTVRDCVNPILFDDRCPTISPPTARRVRREQST
jgi:hypothetical protein